MDLRALSEAVAAGREIAENEAGDVAAALADATVPAGDKEALLEALSQRGETPGEIAGIARAFRHMAVNPGLEPWAPTAIDVCGTGGDRSGTFNISTVVAFTLAAAGVPVIKHGNRSITSQCGSADLLEALGIKLDAEGELLRRAMSEVNFVFLFAPRYHPAFKEIVPVRRALAARGIRTIFNLLGPLLNPARPAHQILGVFGEAFVTPVAQALDSLGLAGGLAVHCVDDAGRRYDELTTVGRNTGVGFGVLRNWNRSFTARDLALPEGPAADLAGGNVAANVALLERVLAGTAPAALIDSIVLNAAAGLLAVGRTATLLDGIPAARDLLLGGAVRAWLEKIRALFRA